MQERTFSFWVKVVSNDFSTLGVLTLKQQTSRDSAPFESRWSNDLWFFHTVCPEDGWVRHGNSSFLIIDIPTFKWSDARRTCQKLGGDLAIITSATENAFIFDLINKQKTVTAWGAWFSYFRKADNRFCRIYYTPLARGYTAWSSGEPNNPLTERCGHMYGADHARGGKWNDIACDVGPSCPNKAPVILCQKTSNWNGKLFYFASSCCRVN